jgi:hypothetical protein
MGRKRLPSVDARMLPSRRRPEVRGDFGQQFIIFRYLALCPGSERRSKLIPKLTPVQEKEKTFSHSGVLVEVSLEKAVSLSRIGWLCFRLTEGQTTRFSEASGRS